MESDGGMKKLRPKLATHGDILDGETLKGRKWHKLNKMSSNKQTWRNAHISFKGLTPIIRSSLKTAMHFSSGMRQFREFSFSLSYS